MKQALLVQGGWDGHQPALVAARFGRLLKQNGFDVRVTDTLETLRDADMLRTLDLIVPCWTMGHIDHALTENVSAAVANGTGLAGCHGGMCDAFREDVLWQFMTGAQWVSHPGGDGVAYTVNVRRTSSPITDGIDDFPVVSEQYYLHVDPAVEVLATTRYPVVNYFHAANGQADVPVCFTKRWGQGRVFYLSLGHHDDVFDQCPSAQIMMERGMLWAADGARVAREQGLTADMYDNKQKMF